MRRFHYVAFAFVSAALTFMQIPQMSAQGAPEVAKLLAPTGKLHVGVLMVPYFAIEDVSTRQIKGVIPDLGAELARRIGVSHELMRMKNPAEMITLFLDGNIDVTFIGITDDRAAVLDFGPVLLNLRTTFLVPAGSSINSIGDVDRPGVRILVPQRSAQEAHLKQIISKATIIPVAVENPRPAVDLIVAGQADVFSHVVPMLASAQRSLPGSRILPGSYYNVPIAIGYQKGAPAVVTEFAKKFVADVKASGFLAQALARMGAHAQGVVVAEQ
jgi:polar amino acid transport system substrate-binding protein